MATYKVETVIKHAASTVGEGPHWDELSQTLLYVDIDAHDVHRWDPASGVDKKIHLDGTVGFVIPREGGGLVLGVKQSIVSLDWDSGTTTTLTTIEERSDNRFNDGKCDASGRLWAGTMNTTKPTRIEGSANLYSMDAKQKTVLQKNRVTISNGMAWTRDNKTMFYIDTPTRQVQAYDFDLDTGSMSSPRVVVDFTKIPEFEGPVVPRPDGMTIDSDDKIWVACIDGGCIGQFDPITGNLLRRVDLPNVTSITSACWGGKDLDQLYVTSLKRSNLTDEQLKTTESLAGSVFRITGLGARGLTGNKYKG